MRTVRLAKGMSYTAAGADSDTTRSDVLSRGEASAGKQHCSVITSSEAVRSTARSMSLAR